MVRTLNSIRQLATQNNDHVMITCNNTAAATYRHLLYLELVTASLYWRLVVLAAVDNRDHT